MKFKFEFSDRDEMDLKVMNCALGAMPLKDLELEEENGYLATRTTFDANENPIDVFYRYGFDNVTFSAEYEEDEPEYYQVETTAYPKGTISNSTEFHDWWCKEHPDRVMRTLRQYGYESVDVYLVFHHQRK